MSHGRVSRGSSLSASPGEKEGDIRPLLDWEAAWLKSFLERLNCAPEEIETALKGNASSTRLEVLHLCKNELRRHGDRARIAHYLTSDRLPAPGGILKPVENRLPHAKKALRLWDKLPEREKLEKYEPKLVSAKDKERDRILDQAAEKLAGDKKALSQIADAFNETWKAEDNDWAPRLRELSSWLVRGRRHEINKGWARDPGARKKVGGLSLDRISSLEQFARLQRAFAHRPTLEKLHNDLEEDVKHGRAVRDKLERLREDRLKKLANAVAMAALGLVADHPDKARRVERFRHEGPRFSPVHAVAIENLESYRPEVSRTRRENRGLMQWSARELAKRLGDACELHGLLFLQVQPNYTSRFCSRCGAPGARGQRLKPSHLIQDWHWSRKLTKARAIEPEKRDEFQRRLIELDSLPAAQKEAEVFLPRQGGVIFRCSNEDCRARGGLQADLNAAANIGLRALLDGRWEFGWTYLPTLGGMPIDKGALRGLPDDLRDYRLTDGSATESKQIINLFRDPSQAADLKNSRWKNYKEFFREVESRLFTFDSESSQL